MKNTLIVNNVDLDQLEIQRKCLRRVLAALDDGKPVSKRNRLALEGVVCMLDDWSDERYYRSEGRRPEGPHMFVVAVSGCSYKQAEHVLSSRLGSDEDYGFAYTLNWG